MAKETGKDYELLTQWVFNQILNTDRVKTIDVKQGIKNFKGKTASHEIDVYWEFEEGGIKYKTIVQAKDWATPIKLEQLLTFKSVLEDIPGQPRGVFVTRTGYQSGAREYAENNGILLYELREPTEEDKADWIQVVHVHLDFSTPKSKITGSVLDEMTTPIHLDLSDSTRLFDEKGVKITTLQRLANSLFPEGRELPPTKMPYKFDKLTFLETGDPNTPRAKVKSLEFTISKTLTTIEYDLVAKDFVGYVLKNVIEGTEKTIPRNKKFDAKKRD